MLYTETMQTHTCWYEGLYIFSGDCGLKVSLEKSTRLSVRNTPGQRVTSTVQTGHVSDDVSAGFTTVCLHNDSFRQFDLRIVTALSKAFFSCQISLGSTNSSFRISIDIDCYIRYRNRAVFEKSTSCTSALKLWTSSSRPSKVCCCHVMWDECGDKSLFRK